jgi:hypothetical protein
MKSFFFFLLIFVVSLDALTTNYICPSQGYFANPDPDNSCNTYIMCLPDADGYILPYVAECGPWRAIPEWNSCDFSGQTCPGKDYSIDFQCITSGTNAIPGHPDKSAWCIFFYSWYMFLNNCPRGEVWIPNQFKCQKDPDYVDPADLVPVLLTDPSPPLCVNGEGFYENPIEEKCNTFYQCLAADSEGTVFFAYRQSCPNGLVWRQESHSCDRPTSTDCIKPSVLCPTDGVQPNSNDCTHFFMCVWGSPILMTCPAGTLFNPETSVCDWPSATNSCSTSRCATNPNESYTFNQVPFGVSCGAGDLGKSKAYPFDATGQTFVYCASTGPVVAYCCEGKTAQIGSMGRCP